jgi:hypothetical protein
MIHNSYAGVSLMEVGFGLAAIALTYALASRISGTRVATLAAWWLALSPIHIIDSSVLLTEIPISVFLLIAVVLLAPIAERDSLEGMALGCLGPGPRDGDLDPAYRLLSPALSSSRHGRLEAA